MVSAKIQTFIDALGDDPTFEIIGDEVELYLARYPEEDVQIWDVTAELADRMQSVIGRRPIGDTVLLDKLLIAHSDLGAGLTKPREIIGAYRIGEAIPRLQAAAVAAVGKARLYPQDEKSENYQLGLLRHSREAMVSVAVGDRVSFMIDRSKYTGTIFAITPVAAAVAYTDRGGRNQTKRVLGCWLILPDA